MTRSKTLVAAALAGALTIGSSTALAAPTTKQAAVKKVGMTKLNGVSGRVTGIAPLTTGPTASPTASLRRLGLATQPMKHLRLALVRGPVKAMRTAVQRGLAVDVYPDERLQYLDTASSDAMG